MSAEIPDSLRERRLLFTVTTGRSGTQLLARALALFRDVDARHEPKPTFSSALRTVLAAPETAREFWLEHKLPAIARSRRPVYAETSHLFCKGFLESLLALGLRPELVHLRRDPRAVARSLLAMGTVPGRTFRGVKYYLSPGDANYLPVPRLGERAFSDYQLCYWYCLEVEQRARAYSRLGLVLHAVELEELSAAGGIAALGRRLALGGMRALGGLRAARLAHSPLNSRPDKKRPIDLSAAQMEREERQVREWAAP